MNRFLHENYALVVGITLPLLLMLVFFIAGNVAKTTIPDPKYDAIFVSNYNEGPNQPYDIRLDDGKISIRRRDVKEEYQYSNWPEIYRFDHAMQTSRKIDIDFKNVVNGRVADPDLDALNQGELSGDEASPDGYKLEYYSRSSGGGIAGEFFGFGRRYGEPYVLKKDARIVPLKPAQPVYSAKFLAWITGGKE
jgi:hypothetical protein